MFLPTLQCPHESISAFHNLKESSKLCLPFKKFKITIRLSMGWSFLYVLTADMEIVILNTL